MAVKELLDSMRIYNPNTLEKKNIEARIYKIIEADCRDVASNVQKRVNACIVEGWWSFATHSVSKQLCKNYMKKKLYNYYKYGRM
jgi:hypothetical protein